MVSVAVIGAGVAGLACAREIVKAGHSVRLFEKSRGAGGRSPTRWVDRQSNPPVGFDHGTQYFHATSEPFLAEVKAAEQAGAVAPWEGRIVHLSYNIESTKDDVSTRWVGVPGMANFGRYLARDLDLQVETRVVGLSRNDSGWSVVLNNPQGEPIPNDEIFDWVVCAIPAEQACELMTEAHPAAAEQAGRVHSSMTWTVLLTFDRPVPTDFDGAFVVDSPLAWVCRDSSKPGRAPGERWIVHATPDWSRDHEKEPAQAVADRLVDVFCSVVGHFVEPTVAKAHRWLYSLPIDPLGSGSILYPDEQLGLCGDWVSNAEIQSAFESGRLLAEQIRSNL